MNGKTNNSTQKAEARQPTHDVKVKRTSAERTSWERIGAGWERDDGSIYIRLIGTQIISEGFTIYPVEVAR